MEVPLFLSYRHVQQNPEKSHGKTAWFAKSLARSVKLASGSSSFTRKLEMLECPFVASVLWSGNSWIPVKEDAQCGPLLSTYIRTYIRTYIGASALVPICTIYKSCMWDIG